MIDIQKNVSLAPYTTFKIGGPAQYFVSAKSESDVKETLEWVHENNVALLIMGGGSNMLVSDDGYKGLVLVFEDVPPRVYPEKKILSCFAGCTLEHLLDQAAVRGYAGMENMAGIPGTVGGAIRGNAGAFGTETKDTLIQVRAIHRETGMIHEFPNEQCEFEYRNSKFKKDANWIVIGGEFQFTQGDPEVIQSIMEDIKARRNSKHDQHALCAGSFFVNPVVENEDLRRAFEEEAGVKSRGNKVPAGWLIDRVGLRGKKVGGAMVSEKHPNYIVNTGDATAEHVIMLVSMIKRAVRDTYNIELQREVQYIGFD